MPNKTKELRVVCGHSSKRTTMMTRIRNLLLSDAVNHLSYNIFMYKLGFISDCIGTLCGYKFTRDDFAWNLPKMVIDKENVQN